MLSQFTCFILVPECTVFAGHADTRFAAAPWQRQNESGDNLDSREVESGRLTYFANIAKHKSLTGNIWARQLILRLSVPVAKSAASVSLC